MNTRVPVVIDMDTPAMRMLAPDAPLPTLADINALEALLRSHVAIGDVAPAACPVEHAFGHNIYSRKIFMPAGSLIVSKRHRFDHFAHVIEGNVEVWIAGQPRMNFQDGDHFLTKGGTKRALYCHEDTWWVTYHGTTATTVEAVEAEIIMPDDEQLEGEQP